MKKLITLFIAISIVSCSKEKELNYAIISGTIENANVDKIAIYNDYTRDKKEINLVDGKFRDTLMIKNNHYFIVENRNMINLYAKKGDIIEFSYDSKKLDSTLVFSGNNSTINSYMSKISEADADIKLNDKDLFTKNEGDFVAHIKETKQAKDDFLFNFNGLPEDFVTKEQANLKYEYLNSLTKYELYHKYYSKKEKFKASDTINAPIKEMNLSNEDDFFFSGNYRSLIEKDYRTKAKKLIEKDSTLGYDIAYFMALKELENQNIKNSLAYNTATFGITYTENLEDYYKLFTEISTDAENNGKIEKDYKKLKALSKGSPSPVFTNYENNAGGVTSLADLKGKFLYIDVWVTWCGPCIREIPSLKKLEKEYHDKNIEFVSISIDAEKDYEKWKKMIVDKELGGTQLLADNDWNSQFLKDYMIKGIPRFILLDTNGNIISSNAPRPSDKKLTTLFDELKL